MDRAHDLTDVLLQQKLCFGFSLGRELGGEDKLK
jgi:hypothetical protein